MLRAIGTELVDRLVGDPKERAKGVQLVEDITQSLEDGIEFELRIGEKKKRRRLAAKSRS